MKKFSNNLKASNKMSLALLAAPRRTSSTVFDAPALPANALLILLKALSHGSICAQDAV